MQKDLERFISENLSKDGINIHKKYIILLDGRIKTKEEEIILENYNEMKLKFQEFYNVFSCQEGVKNAKKIRLHSNSAGI